MILFHGENKLPSNPPLYPAIVIFDITNWNKKKKIKKNLKLHNFGEIFTLKQQPQMEFKLQRKRMKKRKRKGQNRKLISEI